MHFFGRGRRSNCISVPFTKTCSTSRGKCSAVLSHTWRGVYSDVQIYFVRGWESVFSQDSAQNANRMWKILLCNLWENKFGHRSMLGECKRCKLCLSIASCRKSDQRCLIDFCTPVTRLSDSLATNVRGRGTREDYERPSHKLSSPSH